MLGLSKIFLFGLAISTAQAAPTHTKRIAQVISDSTQKWQAACVREFFNRPWSHIPTALAFHSLPQEAQTSATHSL